MGFSINTKEENGIALIFVEGEIDMFTSPNLRDTMLPFFKPSTPGVVVDLSGVSFMDSSGIATLVEGLQWSKKEDRKFILTGLGDTVFNALSLTKLDKVFAIEPDADAALAAME
ncbi:MAG: STAS domain-containing protein [Desulfobacterales bacterium]|nr:STAS domain-containing protein [Desulfobacterales bacterium]